MGETRCRDAGNEGKRFLSAPERMGRPTRERCPGNGDGLALTVSLEYYIRPRVVSTVTLISTLTPRRCVPRPDFRDACAPIATTHVKSRAETAGGACSDFPSGFSVPLHAAHDLKAARNQRAYATRNA